MRRSPIKSIFLKLRNKLKSFNNSYSFCLIVQVWHKIAFYQWKRQWHPTPVLLSGKSHGQRSPSPWGGEESDTTEWLPFHFSLSCIGEGNGNPLQCSCLENPRDGGAWWAAVYGVTQSWTQLKRLSSSSTHMSLPSWNFLLPATHSHPLDYYRALFWVPWVI